MTVTATCQELSATYFVILFLLLLLVIDAKKAQNAKAREDGLINSHFQVGGYALWTIITRFIQRFSHSRANLLLEGKPLKRLEARFARRPPT